jgi:hypothetical protein
MDSHHIFLIGFFLNDLLEVEALEEKRVDLQFSSNLPYLAIVCCRLTKFYLGV